MVDSEEKPEHSDDEQGNAGKGTEECENHPNENRPKTSGVMSLIEFITVILTLVIAGSAFATFLAICVQAWIYNAQLKQMKRSTDAATSAAKSAKESVQFAQDSAQLDQRAWINMEYFGFPEVNKAFRPVITVTNTGKTFARNLEVVATGDGVDKGQVPAFADQIKESASRRDPGEITRSSLAPNAKKQVAMEPRTPEPVSDKAVEAIKDGTKIYFMFGQAMYDDIFEHHHWLTFCVKLNYNPLQLESGGWSWADYGKKENDTGDGEPPWKY